MGLRLALGLVVILALPVLLPGSGAAPTVTTHVTQPLIQKLVDNLLAVPQINEAFKDGQTLRVNVRGMGTGSKTIDHIGTIQGGKSAMRPVAAGAQEVATHVVTINAAAAVSLANAFDPANTGMLILKGRHASLASQETATQIGFNALVKTPASSGLDVYTLEVGRTIQYGGCTGTLRPAAISGYFRVTLCGSDYIVNALGGVNGKMSNKKLSDYACAVETCEAAALRDTGSPTSWDACYAGVGGPYDPSQEAQRLLWRLRLSECLRNENGGQPS